MCRGCCEGPGGQEGFLKVEMPELRDEETVQVGRGRKAVLGRGMRRQKSRGVRTQQFGSIMLGEWEEEIEMETRPCQGIEI